MPRFDDTGFVHVREEADGRVTVQIRESQSQESRLVAEYTGVSRLNHAASLTWHEAPGGKVTTGRHEVVGDARGGVSVL